MFDGCLTKNKKISFSSKSPYLARSIKDILEESDRLKKRIKEMGYDVTAQMETAMEMAKAFRNDDGDKKPYYNQEGYKKRKYRSKPKQKSRRTFNTHDDFTQLLS